MFTELNRRSVGLVAAMTLAGLMFAGAASAAQIYVQQSGTSPAGGDPNIILNSGAFTIGVAGGTFTLQNPLLVIVGVYDGSGTPSISFSGCSGSCPMATVGTYGLTGNTATMMSGQDAWTQLGLTGGGSESFTNWSAADVAAGFAAPTSFSLYAFALDTNLTSGSPIMVGESGAAVGSFILGYSCLDGTGSSTGCATNGDIAETVFTNTGLLKVQVPEPATLALFASALGILGIFLARRRRLRRS